eukprot:1160138-Pelagomonas_calceolata.AAC.1
MGQTWTDAQKLQPAFKPALSTEHKHAHSCVHPPNVHASLLVFHSACALGNQSDVRCFTCTAWSTPHCMSLFPSLKVIHSACGKNAAMMTNVEQKNNNDKNDHPHICALQSCPLFLYSSRIMQGWGSAVGMACGCPLQTVLSIARNLAPEYWLLMPACTFPSATLLLVALCICFAPACSALTCLHEIFPGTGLYFWQPSSSECLVRLYNPFVHHVHLHPQAMLPP